MKNKGVNSEKKFSKAGCEKQYRFNNELIDIFSIDMRRRLEDHFEEIPGDLEELIREGEKKVEDRNHILKIADELGWLGVEKYEKDELARDEKEEKKISKIRKELIESKNAKTNQYSKRGRGGREYRGEERRGERYVHRREGGQGSNDCAGVAEAGLEELMETQAEVEAVDQNATTVIDMAISPMIAGSQIEGRKGEVEGERGVNEIVEKRAIVVSEVDKEGELNYFRDLEAINRLDRLEGQIGQRCEQEDLVDIYVEDKALLVHDSLRRHVEAWKEAGAGRFAIEVIEKGFKLDLEREPERYEEKNNKNFMKEEEFGNEAVLKLLQANVLKEVKKEEVWCVNPLSVAINSEGKRRLCLDLSRHVNKICRTRKFRIESTKSFLEVIGEGDFMWKFDLKSAYHHIVIFGEHQKYLGLSVTVEGVKRYFVFRCLPFGLNDACRALTKLLRFPLQRWRQEGVQTFIHVDDGIGSLRGRERAQAAADRMKEDLGRFGLLTSEDKCEWKVTQELEWTGFVINTKDFKVFVPERKIVKCESKIDELMEKGGGPVKLKELASVVSLIISFGLGMGRPCRFFTRFSSMAIAEAEKKVGWNGMLCLTQEVCREMEYWRRSMRRINGHPIRHRPGVKVVRPKMLYSDAGGCLAGGGQIENRKVYDNMVFQTNLTEEEMKASSTYRELRGVEEGLKALSKDLQGCRVRWHNDNWSCCKIVELGSMKEDCMKVALRINELIVEHGMDFEIVWQRRTSEEIVFADKISKDFDFSDYRLSQEDFNGIAEMYGPFVVDYFASSYSFRMKPFMSRYRCDEGQGADAFAADWSRGLGYFHPPVGLVPRVLRKAEEDGAEGILVVPCWEGSMMLTAVRQHSERRVRLLERFRPFLECPSWFQNKTFSGWPKFDMLVYRMDFR